MDTIVDINNVNTCIDYGFGIEIWSDVGIAIEIDIETCADLLFYYC